MMLARIIACALPVLLAGPAIAQGPATLGDSAKAIIGTWEFSNADRDKTCSVTFKNEPSPLGFKLEFDAKCGDLFPLVRDVAAWKFPNDDLLYLVDAHGKSLIEFSEVEDGIYEAPTPGIGVLFLQNAAAAAPTPDQSAKVAGDWAMVRKSGAPVCLLTLTTNKAGEGFALAIKPGCDPSIARLNFAQWRIDSDELLLLPPRGSPWRFEEGDNNTWHRVPETATSVTLVRQ